MRRRKNHKVCKKKAGFWAIESISSPKIKKKYVYIVFFSKKYISVEILKKKIITKIITKIVMTLWYKKKSYRSYYPHWLRELVSTVCRILNLQQSKYQTFLKTVHIGLRFHFCMVSKFRGGESGPKITTNVWVKVVVAV